MIYKNLLVPFDKSIHATHALETALKLVSDDPEARVTILYVTEAPDNEDITFLAAARIAGVRALESDNENEMETSFRNAKRHEIYRMVQDLIADVPNPVEIKVATGKAHHAILNYAYDHDCDLIVMGSRGLNALRGMLGSVSYAVLRSSEAPVFIVK